MRSHLDGPAGFGGAGGGELPHAATTSNSRFMRRA